MRTRRKTTGSPKHYDSRRHKPGGGDRGRGLTGDRHGSTEAQPEQPHAQEARLPFAARLRREELFRSADDAELQATADRIAGGPERWYSWAGWAPADVGDLLIGFATQAEADAMQRWIAASGIETRPAPPKYDGPQLGVAGAEPS
jgi:hypothetical protein